MGITLSAESIRITKGRGRDGKHDEAPVIVRACLHVSEILFWKKVKSSFVLTSIPRNEGRKHLRKKSAFSSCVFIFTAIILKSAMDFNGGYNDLTS